MGLALDQLKQVLAMSEAEIAKELGSKRCTMGFKVAHACLRDLLAEMQNPKQRSKPMFAKLSELLFEPNGHNKPSDSPKPGQKAAKPTDGDINPVIDGILRHATEPRTGLGPQNSGKPISDGG